MSYIGEPQREFTIRPTEELRTLINNLINAADRAHTDLWWLVGGGDFAADIKDGKFNGSLAAWKEYREAKESEIILRRALWQYQRYVEAHPELNLNSQ